MDRLLSGCVLILLVLGVLVLIGVCSPWQQVKQHWSPSSDGSVVAWQFLRWDIEGTNSGWFGAGIDVALLPHDDGTHSTLLTLGAGRPEHARGPGYTLWGATVGETNGSSVGALRRIETPFDGAPTHDSPWDPRLDVISARDDDDCPGITAYVTHDLGFDRLHLGVDLGVGNVARISSETQQHVCGRGFGHEGGPMDIAALPAPADADHADWLFLSQPRAHAVTPEGCTQTGNLAPGAHVFARMQRGVVRPRRVARAPGCEPHASTELVQVGTADDAWWGGDGRDLSALRSTIDGGKVLLLRSVLTDQACDVDPCDDRPRQIELIALDDVGSVVSRRIVNAPDPWNTGHARSFGERFGACTTPDGRVVVAGLGSPERTDSSGDERPTDWPHLWLGVIGADRPVRYAHVPLDPQIDWAEFLDEMWVATYLRTSALAIHWLRGDAKHEVFRLAIGDPLRRRNMHRGGQISGGVWVLDVELPRER